MTLEQARQIMDTQLSGPPPRWGDTQAALKVIWQHYADHPEKLRPVYTTDQVRYGPMIDGAGPGPGRRTQDQPYPRPERPEQIRTEFKPFDLNASWANIQKRDMPNKVGGRLIQTLPGDLSAYYLATDERTGKTGLFYIDQPQQTPGRVARSGGGMATTMDRGPAYYTALRRQGDVARELAAVPLRAMNEANRKAWEGRGG